MSQSEPGRPRQILAAVRRAARAMAARLRNKLDAVYMSRGNAKWSPPGRGPAATIADYDAAIAIRENQRDAMHGQWPPKWCSDLARASKNREVALKAVAE